MIFSQPSQKSNVDSLLNLQLKWYTVSTAKVLAAKIRQRTQSIKNKQLDDLELRRDRLRSLLEKEQKKYILQYADMLRENEICRKNTLLEESARLKEEIQITIAKMAQKKDKQRQNMASSEFIREKIRVHNSEIVKDQAEIVKFDKVKKSFEKKMDEMLDQPNVCKFTDFHNDEDKKILNRYISGKEIQKTLLEQMSDSKKRRDALKHMSEDRALMEKQRREFEHIKMQERELKLINQTKLKQQFENQIINDHKRKVEKNELEDNISKLLISQWRPIENSNSELQALKKRTNQQAIYFLNHQKQVRENRTCENIQIDKMTANVHSEICNKKQEIELKNRLRNELFTKDVSQFNRQEAEDKILRNKAFRLKEIADEIKINNDVLNQNSENVMNEKAYILERKMYTEALKDQIKNDKERLDTRAEISEERRKYAEAENNIKYSNFDKMEIINSLQFHPWRKCQNYS